jgi:HAD superfamily hydrolase (TIGR01509 family)
LRLQAVLLDVGGVLVDESEFYRLMQTQLLEVLEQEGFSVTEEELTEIFRLMWRRGRSNYRGAILWHFAKPDLEQFQDLRKSLRPLHEFYQVWKPRLSSGVEGIIAALSRNYRLALAGNQPAHVKEFLRSQGILQYFEYDLVSEELGLAKPDPLFFEIILDRLGVRPEEAVMVGDRLDNDIYPAKRLGMRTIRLLSWPFSLQEARTPAEEPNLTIHELKELPEAIETLD